jgi:hypothetical protein
MCTATRWRVHVNTRDMPVHLIVGHYWHVDTLGRVRVLLSAVLAVSWPSVFLLFTCYIAVMSLIVRC